MPCGAEYFEKIIRGFNAYLVGHKFEDTPHGLVEFDGLASGGRVASSRQSENHGSEGNLSMSSHESNRSSIHAFIRSHAMLRCGLCALRGFVLTTRRDEFVQHIIYFVEYRRVHAAVLVV